MKIRTRKKYLQTRRYRKNCQVPPKNISHKQTYAICKELIKIEKEKKGKKYKKETKEIFIGWNQKSI